jgi:rare lipoprotein A (peptidoglycan hydrolase)
MRTRLLTWFAAVAWPFLILAAAPGLQAPLVARAEQQVKQAKPLRVWSGVASWYGPQFQGHQTASGQPYDMFAPTAAHPSLPFGSLVRVVNVRTGHSQLVRINDRGPFVDDREMDLSYLAASRLGLVDRGVSKVRFELLETPQRP